MTSLVSVIMPAFNAEIYILDAVNSILNQSYKNLELIVYDDGSTDGTLEILRSIRDDRLVIFENKINKGIVNALNESIKISKGLYIARMDADDVSDHYRLEKQLSFLKQNNLDIVSSLVRKNSNKYSRIFPVQMNSDEVEYALNFFNPIVHPAVLGFSHIFKKFPYDEKYKWAEDYKLWCDLAKAGYSIGIQNDILLNYRIHAGQISVKRKKIQFELDFKIKKDYRSSYFKDNKSISLKVFIYCAVKRLHLFLKYYKCLA